MLNKTSENQASQVTPAPAPAPENETPEIIDYQVKFQEQFSRSRFCKVGSELWNDVQRMFKVEDKHCYQLASRFILDLGQYLKEDGQIEKVNLGAIGGKDKLITLSAVTAKVKGRVSYSLQVAKYVDGLNKLAKACGYPCRAIKGQMVFNDTIAEWLDK